MVKKKEGRQIAEAANAITLTVADVAGMISMQTRQGGGVDDMQKTLSAAQRVLRIFKVLPYGQPHLDAIETELENGPLDAYTIVGLIEVTRRDGVAFHERIQMNIRENNARLKAYSKHYRGSEATTKEFVKGLWDDWQKRKAQGQDPYAKGNAQFARDVLTKLDNGQNVTQRTITDAWCREWQRE